MEINYVYETASGQHEINLKMFQIGTDIIKKHSDENNIKNLCEIGCVNYGMKWCCPPYSDNVTDISEKYNNCLLLIMEIGLNTFSTIKNPYQRIKAANIIIKSQCEKFTRHLEGVLDGYALLSGSCNLCKPCRKKLDLECAKPKIMRYSLESTGINVQSLVQYVDGYELKWYEKTKKSIPPYTTVVTMVLHNNIKSHNEIYKIISQNVNKFLLINIENASG